MQIQSQNVAAIDGDGCLKLVWQKDNFIGLFMEKLQNCAASSTEIVEIQTSSLVWIRRQSMPQQRVAQ